MSDDCQLYIVLEYHSRYLKREMYAVLHVCSKQIGERVIVDLLIMDLQQVVRHLIRCRWPL